MEEELGLGSFNDKLETDRGNIESMYPLRRKDTSLDVETPEMGVELQLW